MVAGRVNGLDVGWLQRRWVAQVVAFERVVAGFRGDVWNGWWRSMLLPTGKFAFNSSVLDQGLPKGGHYSRSTTVLVLNRETGDAGPLDPIDKIR